MRLKVTKYTLDDKSIKNYFDIFLKRAFELISTSHDFILSMLYSQFNGWHFIWHPCRRVKHHTPKIYKLLLWLVCEFHEDERVLRFHANHVDWDSTCIFHGSDILTWYHWLVSADISPVNNAWTIYENIKPTIQLINYHPFIEGIFPKNSLSILIGRRQTGTWKWDRKRKLRSLETI